MPDDLLAESRAGVEVRHAPLFHPQALGMTPPARHCTAGCDSARAEAEHPPVGSDMAAQADLVVTTGGEEDHVKPAFVATGAEPCSSAWRSSPASVPFDRTGSAFCLGLLGNSRAAFTTWQVCGRSLLVQAYMCIQMGGIKPWYIQLSHTGYKGDNRSFPQACLLSGGNVGITGQVVNQF